jgi:hypothetical protein
MKLIVFWAYASHSNGQRGSQYTIEVPEDVYFNSIEDKLKELVKDDLSPRPKETIELEWIADVPSKRQHKLE